MIMAALSLQASLFELRPDKSLVQRTQTISNIQPIYKSRRRGVAGYNSRC